jgi:hypothetical protein
MNPVDAKQHPVVFVTPGIDFLEPFGDSGDRNLQPGARMHPRDGKGTR